METNKYFARNGIALKTLREITPEQAKVDRLPAGSGFYSEAARTGFDDFVDCVDYDITMRVFDFLGDESMKYGNVFEPCCYSGLLGCFLGAELGVNYHGMDINQDVIAKARQRAVSNGQSPEIFICDDVKTYLSRHEAIVGRWALNSDFLICDHKAISSVCKLADNIAMAVKCQPGRGRVDLSRYESVFDSQGFRIEIVRNIMPSLTHSDVFLMRARKK